MAVNVETSQLYIFQRSMQAMQANRNINLWQKKRPFSSYPAEKHPKHSKFAITDIREKPVNFFLLFNTGADFSLHNNFANSGSCSYL